MIKLLVFISVTVSSIAFAKDDISIPFTEENARYWQYISDQTMGGVSNGQAVLDKDGDMIFARLTGNVSTANNGGFIQIRTNFSFVDLINTNKDESRTKVIEVYPELSSKLSRKKDSNKADAILIARYFNDTQL